MIILSKIDKINEIDNFREYIKLVFVKIWIKNKFNKNIITTEKWIFTKTHNNHKI
jgi:hypothetical protein